MALCDLAASPTLSPSSSLFMLTRYAKHTPTPEPGLLPGLLLLGGFSAPLFAPSSLKTVRCSAQLLDFLALLINL